jgi:hypothetical protein
MAAPAVSSPFRPHRTSSTLRVWRSSNELLELMGSWTRVSMHLDLHDSTSDRKKMGHGLGGISTGAHPTSRECADGVRLRPPLHIASPFFAFAVSTQAEWQRRTLSKEKRRNPAAKWRQWISYIVQRVFQLARLRRILDKVAA